jgi:hypothetical protein
MSLRDTNRQDLLVAITGNWKSYYCEEQLREIENGMAISVFWFMTTWWTLLATTQETTILIFTSVKLSNFT